MARICLILEGTYPFVTGGVSNWVQMLVSGIPEHEFTIAHIYTGKQPEQKKYRLPDNVAGIKRIPLNINEKNSDMRSIVQKTPKADIYHALSTGFAGLIGTEIKRHTNAPFILTEHGIYWHEIALGVDEVECGFKIIRTEDGELALGKSWGTWFDTFKNFARQAYESADEITTVCQTNLEKQLLLDANKEKCSVIYNGVHIKNDKESVRRTKPNTPQNIGLVGRVTSIKDIETFIRSCAIVKQKLPQAKFYVIGPTDQNEKYYQKCLKLTTQLNLTDLIFTGEACTSKYYNMLDIVVLTSKSEGLPFALLESMAAGIPVVATDVGGCWEVVNGNGDQFGAAGLICSVEDAPGIAGAIFELSVNPEMWCRCSQAGRSRVNAFYRSDLFLDEYRALYSKYLA